MNDRVEAVFNVDRPQHQVWEACRLPSDAEHPLCRLPAFPSLDGKTGCAATVLEMRPQQFLRLYKDDEPCKGTEIGIQVDPATAAGWPTRVTLWQSGFGPWFEAARDVFETHWRQIAANFELYVSRGITVPGTIFGDFGATVSATPTGLELAAIDAGGFAARCGMATGDLLLTVGPIRIHSIEQLWTAMALLPSDAEIPATWARGTVRMAGHSAF